MGDCSTFTDKTPTDKSFELEDEGAFRFLIFEFHCTKAVVRQQFSKTISADRSAFLIPNYQMLYNIFSCLPVSSASAEGALSKLKIVKNHLRTSITDDTLASLLLLAAEQDIMTQLTSDDIIARLVKSHPSLKSHLLFLSLLKPNHINVLVCLLFTTLHSIIVW